VTRSAFVTVALIAACGDPAPLRIAVVEGSDAPVAAQLAVEDINAAGGINGRLLELSIVNEPPAVTPRHAIAVADSLSRDRSILAVIGHGGSATSLAASQVYNTQRVPQIAPSTSSPLYAKAGPFSFRMVAGDEHQAAFIAQTVAAAEFPRIAILHINDDYGIALNDFLSKALRENGITPIYEAPFIGGASFEGTVDGLVQSLKTAKPDLLIWIGLSPQLQALRPHLRRELPKLKVLGSDGVSFIGTTPDLASFEGDWLVALTDVNANRPALRSVAERFRPITGRALTDAAALTYDAVGLIAAAMRAGARTRAAIQEQLARDATGGKTYEGITGPIVLDENGDARPSYVLLEVTSTGTRVLTK
jgi:branched-chain amino acid transport system substrate-binding protein